MIPGFWRQNKRSFNGTDFLVILFFPDLADWGYLKWALIMTLYQRIWNVCRKSSLTYTYLLEMTIHAMWYPVQLGIAKMRNVLSMPFLSMIVLESAHRISVLLEE